MKPLFLEWLVSSTLRDFKMCEKAMELCKEEERRRNQLILIIFVSSLPQNIFKLPQVHLGHWGTGSHGAPVHLAAPVHWFTWCTGSPGGTSALVHMVHRFTWGIGSPGAPVHLGHWCTGSRFTWGTGSPGPLVHWFTWCTGPHGALVHLGYSMTKHLCCPHYGLWHLQHCKQDSVWLPVT